MNVNAVGASESGAQSLTPDEILRQSFGLAVASHDRGALADAEQLYRAILAVRPDHADALHGLGVIAHQVGAHDLAAQYLSLALNFRREAVFHNNLGLVLLAQNRPNEAMAEVFKALELRAAYPQAYNALGNIQDRLGLKDEAIASYSRAIELSPNYVDALSNLGKVRKDGRAFEEARSLFERALAINSDCVEALNNLGALCRETHDDERAFELLSRAIALRPHYAEAYVNRGQTWLAKDEYREAEADFRCALALKPDLVPAHCGLGAVCFKSRRVEEAIEHYDRALELDESFGEALTGAGAAHLQLDHFEEARRYLDRAVAQEEPEARAQSHFLLGTDLHLKGRVDESIASFDLALSYDPDHCDARNNRSLVFQNKGDLATAIAGYDEVLQRNERHLAAFSNRLMAMHYVESVTNDEMLGVARKFGAIHDQPAFLSKTFADRNRDPERRLRIGYVSGDLNAHPVGMYLLKVFEAHDPNAVEIFCYSNDPKHDYFTEKLKARASGWREIKGVGDNEAVEMITEDRIDILVDLSGHTNKNRILLFARRAAPIQVEWIGYFGTTGLKAMDYIVLDPVSAPRDHDRFYVEKVVRLPYGRFCYTPPPFEIDVVDPPVLRDGRITFGSFNNISKIGESVIALWSRLVLAVPGSRLVLKWKTLNTDSVRSGLKAAFARHGVGPDRIELRGESPHYVALVEYGDIDIALDPFPFGGATTSCEALWMGVPVLTLPGERLASRQTLGFLDEMGATELAATSEDDFVARGAALASDRERLADYRRRLRPALEGAAFNDGPKFTRTLEAAYRTMWRKYVAGENPAAFDVVAG